MRRRMPVGGFDPERGANAFAGVNYMPVGGSQHPPPTGVAEQLKKWIAENSARLHCNIGVAFVRVSDVVVPVPFMV